MFFRDSRLSDEARNHLQIVTQNFPPPKSFDLKAMRERSENVSAKINEKLIGTFKGTEEEKLIKVDENTGNLCISNKYR